MNLDTFRVWCYACEKEVFLEQRLAAHPAGPSPRFSEQVRGCSGVSAGGGDMCRGQGPVTQASVGPRWHLFPCQQMLAEPQLWAKAHVGGRGHTGLHGKGLPLGVCRPWGGCVQGLVGAQPGPVESPRHPSSKTYPMGIPRSPETPLTRRRVGLCAALKDVGPASPRVEGGLGLGSARRYRAG